MPTPIIIVTLLREQGETGVQTHFNSFKQACEQMGNDIVVVTPFSLSRLIVLPLFGLRKIVEKISKPASVWWYRHWHYWALKAVLTRILRMRKDVIIYAQCPLSAKAALLARSHSNQLVRMVVHFNISQADEWVGKGMIRGQGNLYRSIEQLEADVLPLLDGIVYVSRYSRSILERRIPEVKNVVSTVIPNFVSDIDDRGLLPVTGDLLNIGTLEPRKNQKFLLKVIAEAKRQGKRYTLTLIGDGPDRKQLQALSQELNIQEQIVFKGFQAEAARSIPAYRLYVHSALMENLSIVLIESLACGIPVLAAPVGGTTEIFEDGVEGYYWSLDDPAGAAKKIIFLLEKPTEYKKMSVAAKKRFLNDFETNAVARRLLNFLQTGIS